MPSAESNIVGGNLEAKTRCREPLVYSGSLERFTHADITPVIGREYEGLQVTELRSADDAMIRDLASISTHSAYQNLGGPLY